MYQPRVAELIDDVIDPVKLQMVEFVVHQAALDKLQGKTITEATVEETRVVLKLNDGSRYFFYGFMGHSGT